LAGRQKDGTLAPATEHLNDILVAGATAITDMNNLINELQTAAYYLRAGRNPAVRPPRPAPFGAGAWLVTKMANEQRQSGG
jgi:hypothetical protein